MSRRTGERLRVLQADSNTIVSPPTTPPRDESLAPMPCEASTSNSTSTIPSMDRLDATRDTQDDISWMLDYNPGSHMSMGDDNLHEFRAGTDVSTVAPKDHPPRLPNVPPIQEFDISFEFPDSYTERNEAAHMQPQRSECATSMQTRSTASPQSRIIEVRQRKTIDCASEALALVVDIHVAARGCLTADKDAAARFDLEYNALDTHDIETVLLRNREAMRKLNSFLDCQCSRSGEVLVTIYLALGKAIRWYAGILGNDSSACEDQNYARIVAKPVFMGSYCLDTKAQRIISAHVVLTQLKEHVTPLLKRLECRRSSASRESAMSSRSLSSPSSPTSTGAGCLIECHHQVLQEQLSRLTMRATTLGRADT